MKKGIVFITVFMLIIFVATLAYGAFTDSGTLDGYTCTATLSNYDKNGLTPFTLDTAIARTNYGKAAGQIEARVTIYWNGSSSRTVWEAENFIAECEATTWSPIYTDADSSAGWHEIDDWGPTWNGYTYGNF